MIIEGKSHRIPDAAQQKTSGIHRMNIKSPVEFEIQTEVAVA